MTPSVKARLYQFVATFQGTCTRAEILCLTDEVCSPPELIQGPASLRTISQR